MSEKFSIGGLFDKVAEWFTTPKSSFADYKFEEGKVLPALSEGHRFAYGMVSTMQSSGNYSAIMQVKSVDGKNAGDVRFDFPNASFEGFKQEVRAAGIPCDRHIWCPLVAMSPVIACDTVN